MLDTLDIGLLIFGYFLMLLVISYLTSRNEKPVDFYTANRQSKWYLVAFGMIGASLSGVTFISVPGEVSNSYFYYFQMVLGYLAGYYVIAKVLIPLYYQLNLVSIYGYLKKRFGHRSYKMGALFFLISRLIGSSFRLFLVATVLQISFFDSLNLPFELSVFITIALIWIYTFRGGIKTIVWTDTLQTFCMLLSVGVTLWYIKGSLGWAWSDAYNNLSMDIRSSIFNLDWKSPKNFFKQFFSGAFIAIVMTGLDQDMMQKNLTCKNSKEAQKNIFWFCAILVIVNFIFLCIGLMLYQYAEINSIKIPAKSDELFPALAVFHFPYYVSLFFIIGIIAAAYSSADSALTSLTTSFCVDFLDFKQENYQTKKKTRIFVHVCFSILILFVVLIFNKINDQSVINSIFIVAGYTYGPILGLFVVGLLTQWEIRDKYVPLVCFFSPLLSFIININSKEWLFGYAFGFEILILNGLLTLLGLRLLKKPTSLFH